MDIAVGRRNKRPYAYVAICTSLATTVPSLSIKMVRIGFHDRALSVA